MNTTVTITINLDEAVGLAMRRLAVIGKRNVDKQGNQHFADVTVSSAEQPLLKDYARAGAHSLISALAEMLNSNSGLSLGAETDEADYVSLTITRSRWQEKEGDGIPPSFAHFCMQYVVAYVCFEFLSLTRPDLAKKHGDDMQRFETDIRIQLHHKTEPAPSVKDLADVNGLADGQVPYEGRDAVPISEFIEWASKYYKSGVLTKEQADELYVSLSKYLDISRLVNEATAAAGTAANSAATASANAAEANRNAQTAMASVAGVTTDVADLRTAVTGLANGLASKASAVHTHPHTSITDWDAATATFLTTATASATYLSKTDAAATYATIASVPTKTSDLTNDSGFITNASLSGYATQEWVQDAWDAYDQQYHMTTAYTKATAAQTTANEAKAEIAKHGLVVDVIDTGSSAPVDSGSTASTTGQMYYVSFNQTFYLKVGNNFYSQFPNYPHASLYTNDSDAIFYCGNVPYQFRWTDGEFAPLMGTNGVVANTSRSITNETINSLVQVISRSDYEALTPTQQASKIYFIYEDSNSSAS